MENKKIFCNECKRATNHEVKHNYTISSLALETPNDFKQVAAGLEPATNKYYDEDTYSFLICLGCQTPVIEHSYIPFYVNRGGYLEFEDEPNYYPPRLNSGQLIPKHFKSITPEHQRIYNEIIESFNSGIDILCSVGVRTLLEKICVIELEKITITNETKKQTNDLKDKLSFLNDKMHLSDNIIDGLGKLRIIGNNAAHQLSAPTKEELRLSIEILEDILNRLYETEYRISSNLDKLNSKQDALNVLTEGFVTLDQGLKLFDEITQSKLTIITEGYNTVLIKKALELYNVKEVNILNGCEKKSGASQLNTVFDFFTKIEHKNKVLFVWDCDVKSTKNPTNNTYPFYFPKNEENKIAGKGIENLFPSSLFDEQFQKSTKRANGEIIINFDGDTKQKFTQFILGRNNPEDFENFSSLIDEIKKIQKEADEKAIEEIVE